VNATENATGRFPGLWKPNAASAVPLFEQLRLNIIERADNGTLAPGTKLPAVRSLASELGVAPHTVARAYKELEAAGVVATRGRNGTVVCARDEAWSSLSAAAADFAEAAKARGASFAEAVQLLAAAYDRL
jgi:GntR family transcriptional regulator